MFSTRTRAALVAATLLLGLTACGGSDHDDADVTFAQQMVPHHEQALAMVAMTKGHTLDPAVQDVVAGIEKAQTPEISTMKGWLADWDEKVPSGSMSGMDMPGMMSSTEMTTLGNTADPDFQKLWLELMVQHHEGALAMAKAEIAKGSDPDAVALATSIQRGQTKEIATMKALLAG